MNGAQRTTLYRVVGFLPTFDRATRPHESTHITNMEDLRYNSLGDFSDEYRAYQSSGWAAAALWQYHGSQGTRTFTLNGNGSSDVIWNSSWGAVDDKAITHHITNNYKYSNGKPYQETTPHDPWGEQK
jgi:hypothetical protein